MCLPGHDIGPNQQPEAPRRVNTLPVKTINEEQAGGQEKVRV